MGKYDRFRVWWDSWFYEVLIAVVLLVGIGLGFLAGWLAWGRF